ncbi:MAG: hypothetical protein WC091_26005 [Sulfuricellaceae bacterium]
MIGLDTNVLARYYIEDENDEESARQHQAARRLIESGQPLMVCMTVVLELEWVMRGWNSPTRYTTPATEAANAWLPSMTGNSPVGSNAWDWRLTCSFRSSSAGWVRLCAHAVNGGCFHMGTKNAPTLPGWSDYFHPVISGCAKSKPKHRRFIFCQHGIRRQ